MELGTRAWRWFYQLFSSQGPAARLLQGQGIRDGCSRRIISFPLSALTEKCSHSSISFSTRDSPAGLELAATSPRCAKTLLHTGNKINQWILTVQLILPHTRSLQPKPRAVASSATGCVWDWCLQGEGLCYDPLVLLPCSYFMLS